MGYGPPHFLFSNHPLPIHFPFSPILFSLYIPSLHSSFTFIICIIFFLSLPHPLNSFSFAPSLPSIILPLLIIPPLCPISPLAYLYCPSPPPLPFTPTSTTTILKISSPEMSSVLEHGIWSAPLPLFQPSPPHPFSLFPYPLLPLYSQPTLILHLYHLHHLLSLLTSPSQSLFFRPLPPLNHPSTPHHPPSVPHLTPCLPILPSPPPLPFTPTSTTTILKIL